MSSNGNYGSVTNSVPVVNGDSHAHADEEQPLLGGGGGGGSRKTTKSLRKKLTTDVQRDWADLVLLACYIITGLLDSSSISIWGSFVSMQTGTSSFLVFSQRPPQQQTRRKCFLFRPKALATDTNTQETPSTSASASPPPPNPPAGSSPPPRSAPSAWAPSSSAASTASSPRSAAGCSARPSSCRRCCAPPRPSS